ncbi:DUF934 domain-containing protein [Cereibacter azotoformans]|uniref:Uncharacterized protein DUF934 n=1 Tax=Cereibacter azotoformans TaxID=43057 RepID=A0A2T5KEU1_9RHOB|nr:DUF934 domain-containing protein [Cereibacter azotoformans]AXQ92599.1 DUF934 domain-containing protein [Cereibacter sphaeroides]MBO4169820.1 DUF934 domain-containing protein [Cereibacter azotoformans]PTR20921.1 uncharacterized protein DUF934 [Cereibacter azotoformans]UIJ30875.1 DUF934 domain-containing protein [Cereibacter azotoformans]
MSIIVTDKGFVADDWPGEIAPLEALADGAEAVDLANTDDPARLGNRLERLGLIRIAFPSFSDGRGFTLARRLRRMGYRGRLRAFGPLIADQYAMARRSGFDEVEIPDDLAARQPEDQWLFRANWQNHDYQSQLKG